MIDPVTYIAPQKGDSAGKNYSPEEELTFKLSETIDTLINNVLSDAQDPVIIKAFDWLGIDSSMHSGSAPARVENMFVPVVLFCHALENDCKYKETMKNHAYDKNIPLA